MVRNEIGSEFWDVPVVEQENSLFPESTQWYLSGRSALTAIIRDIKHKKEVHTVAMPSWCCESMVIPFLEEGIDVYFYPVYWKDGLVQEIIEDVDVVFLMDYFGYTPIPSSAHPCIIRDVTHSIFSHHCNGGQYCFGSLRKWCGLKTGGYAWGLECGSVNKDEGFISLRTFAMQEKAKYISGEIKNKDYLKAYEGAEEYLDKMSGVYCALPADVYAARHLNDFFIRERRRKNARVLMSALSRNLIFSTFSREDCPMFVPILVPDGKRDALRRHLIQHDIYCPIHWPVSTYHKLGDKELKIYQNELSLVCDQRYTEEDMYRMVDTIALFWK